MNTQFRVLAAMGILIVAATACGKGKSPEATGAVAGKSEAMASSSRHAKVHAKTGSAAPKTAAAPAGRVSNLTMADDGGSFTLVQGQVLSVILAANHSAGSSWNQVEPSQSVIEADGKPVYVMKTAKAGTETWHFRAERPGRQTVRLEYGRPWARHVPERTFRFTVTVR
jgi:inhibitor of cysteine peptidase